MMIATAIVMKKLVLEDPRRNFFIIIILLTVGPGVGSVVDPVHRCDTQSRHCHHPASHDTTPVIPNPSETRIPRQSAHQEEEALLRLSG